MREVYSNMSLPQETRKTSNKHPNLEEEEEDKKNSRRKEIMKIRVEKIEKKWRQQQRSVKLKIWFFEKMRKTDKPLARIIKKIWEKTQVNKIRNE